MGKQYRVSGLELILSGSWLQPPSLRLFPLTLRLCLWSFLPLFMKYTCLKLNTCINLLLVCRIWKVTYHFILYPFQSKRTVFLLVENLLETCGSPLYARGFTPWDKRQLHRSSLDNVIFSFGFCWGVSGASWVTHLISSVTPVWLNTMVFNSFQGTNKYCLATPLAFSSK